RFALLVYFVFNVAAGRAADSPMADVGRNMLRPPPFAISKAVKLRHCICLLMRSDCRLYHTENSLWMVRFCWVVVGEFWCVILSLHVCVCVCVSLMQCVVI